MIGDKDEITSQTKLTNFRADELILHRARAATRRQVPSSTSILVNGKTNSGLNSVLDQRIKQQPSPTFEAPAVLPPPRQYFDNQIKISSINSMEPNFKEENADAEILRLNNELRISQEFFQYERENMMRRIKELEIDIKNFSYEKRKQEERQKQNIHEIEQQRSEFLSQELTKMLLKNASLLEENAVLKSFQITLSSRVSLLEEKLSAMEAPKRENIQKLLETLQLSEAELQNQAKRLAQLESFYTRELQQLLSSALAGRAVIPVLEDKKILEPAPAAHKQQDKPTSPSQLFKGPLKLYSSKSSSTNECPSYSELFYKCVTDKAISIMEREAENCDVVLNRVGKQVTSSAALTTQRQSHNYHQGRTDETRASQIQTPSLSPKSSNSSTDTIMLEEDEILSQLFFKF